MRKIGILGLVGVLAVLLVGCGGGDPYYYPPPPVGPTTVTIQTLSVQGADGDIGFTPPGTYSISQANISKNLFYGLDASGTEFRAFLDFPLNGSSGGGVVPLNAVIISAYIEVFVNDISFSPSVPTLLDLVPFPLNGLDSVDFDSAPFLTRAPFNILRSDIGFPVRIDVTSLMLEAQARGLRDLQLRFLLDFSPGASGLVELDDDVAARAPLLTVEFQ